MWEVPCEIALPSATQNELTAEAAATMVRHGCVAVGEAANAGGVSTTAACAADACGAPGNHVVGANVAAFTRVADTTPAMSTAGQKGRLNPCLTLSGDAR